MADTLHEHAPNPTAEAARQAQWGSPILKVLLVSTFGAAALMVLVWAFSWGSLQRVEARMSAERTAAAPQGGVPDANAPLASTPKSSPSPPQE